MEYSKVSYEPINWKDYPSTSTKLNAENLNRIDTGIMQLVTAVVELRNLLGEDDLTEKQSSIISAINNLSGKFGGYMGYNLLNMDDLEEVTNGYAIRKSVDDIGLTPGSSYTVSMEGDNDTYLYELGSDGTTLALHNLTDIDRSESFTLNADCTDISVLFVKAQGYVSEESCRQAHIMLEQGTTLHEYEPYTGGEQMSNLWEEILENQNDIVKCKKSISACEEFISGFSDILEGSY